jgi:hypothetical protein
MRVCSWILGVLLGVGAAGGAVGQQADAGVASGLATSGTAKSVAAVLRSLTGRAGVVFVGQVEKVRPIDGVVEITFAVQQVVLGEVGSTYVMREWAGRWAGGQQRFVVGQRAMFFLHAPNAAGLSSPVEGMAGAVPVIPMGAHAATLLDIRWLATRVERPVGSAMVSADTGAITVADAVAVVKGGWEELIPEPVRLPLPRGVLPRPVMYPVGGGPVEGPSPSPVAGPIFAGPVVVERSSEPVARRGSRVEKGMTDDQR